MSSGSARVVLDIMFEIDDGEFCRESGMDEDESLNEEYIKDGIREQIEEAVKDSGGGSSIDISFGDENTQITFHRLDID